MNLQQMDKYLDNFKEILKQVKDEVKKLHCKQEELNRREQNILTIKDNTTQILKILLEQQQALKKIEELKQVSTIIEEQQQQEPQTSVESKKQEQLQEPPTPIERKIQSLNKAKEIKHKSYVYSIT